MMPGQWRLALRVTGIALVVTLLVVGVALLHRFFPQLASRSIGRLQGRLDAEKAGLAVAKIEAQEGAAAARAEVLACYAHQMEVLDVRQKAQAESLEKDPVALARYLVRVGSTVSR
jgi:hypothetical protein